MINLYYDLSTGMVTGYSFDADADTSDQPSGQGVTAIPDGTFFLNTSNQVAVHVDLTTGKVALSV